MDYTKLASDEAIERVRTNLAAHGIDVVVVENGVDAKAKALELIPRGSEVMTMTSVTLASAGIAKEIDESGNFNSVRNKLNDPSTPPREKKRIGSAPEWTIGSVHAVTEEGSVLIASNTGSQEAAYVHGADHVIWVVGTQKIVKNTEEGIRRIYDHVLPLESERARKAYNLPDFSSFVSKLLIVNREVTKGRITVLLVKEALGF